MYDGGQLGTPGGQKGVSDPLEGELTTICESPDVDAGNFSDPSL